MLIAIDGPAASGKGTLARRLAAHFGLVYLDTGKLYRAAGAKFLDAGGDAEAAENHDPEAERQAAEIANSLNIKDLERSDLGCEAVGKAASVVSAIPAVRAALLGFQKRVAATPGGAVLDGRDIGTVVCPEAGFKFYITASLETRAERRFKELQSQGKPVIYSAVLQDLEQRDARDKNRAIAPLKAAEDAVRIDTTGLDMDKVFAKVLALLSSASGCFSASARNGE